MRAWVRCFVTFLPIVIASLVNAQELGPPPTAPTLIGSPESVPPEVLRTHAVGYDTASRETVRTAYNSTWVPSRTAPIAWTGNAAGCAEGTISQQWNDSVITSLNFLRNLAGVPGGVALDAANSAKAQKAALMFSVNKQLSHTPPASWTCYTADGATAASNSNICISSVNLNPGCLELYMDDFGSGNTAVGHRRWIVYPQTQSFGDGDVPANGSNFAGNALWVFDGRFGTARPATRDPYVAWPSPGYFPYQLVPNRWSFSYPNANFSGASVTLAKDGVSVPLTLEAVQNGFGENTIVFFPTGADVTRPSVPAKPPADTNYTVTIQNVMISGNPQNFVYSVVVFDPATDPAPPNPGCTYQVNPSGQVFGPTGGTGAINITAGPGCVWTLSNIPGWVTLGGALSGVGNGTINYQVIANAGDYRTAALAIANIPFTIEQQAASIPGLSYVGAMPHIAAQDVWRTTFTLVNKSVNAAAARLSMFGDPSGALTLPLVLPQVSSNELLAASLDRTIAGNASLVVNTGGPQTPPVQVGSAQLSSTGLVDGFAIFHLITGAQEAVVPLETRNAASYLLAFDNTGGVVLGVAVQNVLNQAASIPVVIRDDAGLLLSAPGTTLSLAANGHSSFVLSTQYPFTANKRGTIEFSTPAGGRISVLGIRTTPMGNTLTLTTIPALANIGGAGGSIAHIATGNGWQTTFVLVNTGAAAAQATLKFFATATGAPLSLPLSFPQSGTGAITLANTVTQNLAAGATLVVQSTAPSTDPAPTIGSAQLTTNGNVGGFVIFRYNPNGQEAVVPLENRTANSYVIAFDNTAGTATGIAMNSVSPQAANVPVTLRDDAGNQFATDTLTLAANGHMAFTLGVDKYPAAAGKRGTIEFGTPVGGKIGVLGIRIPPVLTFTTLPPLAK